QRTTERTPNAAAFCTSTGDARTFTLRRASRSTNQSGTRAAVACAANGSFPTQSGAKSTTNVPRAAGTHERSVPSAAHAATTT
ncbi:hypothetical protein GGI05_000415, partial [Coemansia sp. RSA 2603]